MKDRLTNDERQIMDYFYIDEKFLGIAWSFWKIFGWLGNIVFFSRFIIQWIATERKRKVVVPLAFWYCSLLGSFILLIYAIHQRDSVFIGAYVFTWLPYTRNLYFAMKEQKVQSQNPAK